MNVGTKVGIALGVEAIVFGALLFGGAGTFDWPAGWAFMILFFVLGALMSLWMIRHSPDLINARLKPLVQKGQPLWDRVLMIPFVVLFFGWMVLIGLDAVRFHWSTVPVWVQVVGGVILVVGLWISFLAMRANRFAIAVVRVQEERGHTVISTGPYAIVRHPLYSGALIYMPAMALMLGSWWGLATSVVLAGMLILRTFMEDRVLQRGLEGYQEYTQRVRYRLVPFVW